MPATLSALRSAAARLPRFLLTHLPTPLDPLPNLSKALGGRVRLFAKRDDLTTIGMGGNKLRKLEFSLGEAFATGCDCILHGLAGQSNYCRQTAAASAKAGLPCYLVLRQGPKSTAPPQANLLLDHIFGAQVQMVPADAPPDAQQNAIDALVARLKSQGRKPYVIGADDEILGAVAYALAMAEILEQSVTQGFTPDAVAVTGRTGTLAGLLLGKHLLGFNGRVQAFDVDPRSNMQRWAGLTSGYARDAAKLLGFDAEIGPADVHNTVDYAGAAYGASTPECLDALLLLGRTEGLVVGPTYTAKGLAGLIDFVRKGKFPPTSSVVFLHSGGVTEPFAYNTEIYNRLKEIAPSAIADAPPV